MPYATILPSCFPNVPNEGGRLNTMFDSYKASDSNAGWYMVHPVVTLERFKPMWLRPGQLQSVKLAKLVILL
jgi:hypothetical protein